MIYMYFLPVAQPDLGGGGQHYGKIHYMVSEGPSLTGGGGTTLNGLVVYGSHEQEIQPEEVDPAFIQSLLGLMSCVKN